MSCNKPNCGGGVFAGKGKPIPKFRKEPLIVWVAPKKLVTVKQKRVSSTQTRLT